MHPKDRQLTSRIIISAREAERRIREVVEHLEQIEAFTAREREVMQAVREAVAMLKLTDAKEAPAIKRMFELTETFT